MIEVAMTVTLGGFGTVAGAVYRPVAVIDPHACPWQPLPETLHETTAIEVPVTVAVNCRCEPAVSCAVAGETLTVIVALAVANPKLTINISRVMFVSLFMTRPLRYLLL
jgi:hypothetical protein